MVSGLEVFEEFVTVDKSGKRSAEKIFSKECFYCWLRTRKKQLKHPVDSFKRSVLAHIRGKDGRHPFDQDVEESLLRILRSCRPGESPWRSIEACPTEKRSPSTLVRRPKAGKNGAYGFHEIRRFQTQPVFSVTASLSSMWNMPKEDITRKIEVAQEAGITLVSPASLYLLRHVTKDVRLSEEFTCPKPEQCKFSPGLRVWGIQINSKDLLFKNASDGFCGYAASEIIGRHISELWYSEVEMLHGLRHILPYMEKEEAMWFRTRLVTKDRQPVVHLCCAKRKGNCDTILTQDQTHLWLSLNSSNPFLV